MLARIVRYLLYGGLGVAVLFVLRRVVLWVRARSQGDAATWDTLAVASPRFAEALELRSRIADLASAHGAEIDAGGVLLTEVDGILDPLAGLVLVHVDLGRHLAGLDVKLTGAERGPGRVDAQRAKIAALRGHERRLQIEISGVVTELRQIYLDLLEGLTVAAVDGDTAAERAQSVAARVEAHVAAAAEVREVMAELDG